MSVYSASQATFWNLKARKSPHENFIENFIYLINLIENINCLLINAIHYKSCTQFNKWDVYNEVSLRNIIIDGS